MADYTPVFGGATVPAQAPTTYNGSPAPAVAPVQPVAQGVPNQPVSKPGLGETIGAGALGAGNGLLFGIPEFIYRRLGNEKTYQDFLKRNKDAYNVGNVGGSIGSAFIPGIGLAAKGAKAVSLGAKALAGAKAIEGAAAPAVASLGSKLLEVGGRGALLGAAEGGLRGATGADIGQELKGAQEGAGSGAAFGALGGAAGQAISSAAPRIAAVLKKGSEKAVLGTTEGKARQFLQMVTEMTPPGSGPGAKLVHSDKLREDLTGFIKDKKLWQEGAVEREYERVSGEFKKFDKAYDMAAGNRPAKEVLAGLIDPEDTAFLQTKYQGSPEVLKAAQDSIMKDIGNVSGAAPIREQLKAITEHARGAKVNPNLPFADAQFNAARYDIAKTLRNNLDTSVVRVAEDMNIPIDKNFKRDWGFLQPLEKGALKADWTPAANNLGSNTAAKLLMAGGPGAALGGISGFSSGGQDQNFGGRLANAALGTVAGYGLQKGLGRAAIKGAAGLNTLANKLPALGEKLAANPAAASTVGAGLGSLIGAPQAGAQATQEQPQAVQAQAGPSDLIGSNISAPEYQGAIANGLAREWFKATGGSPQAGAADPSNPMFAQWAQGMMGAMQTNGKIDPVKIAPLIFNSKAQAEAYKAYASAKQSIIAAAGQAGPNTGIVGNVTGALTTGAPAAREAILGAVEQMAGKGGKAARLELNTFLSRTAASPQAILAKTDELVKKYNPELANAIRSLGQ